MRPVEIELDPDISFYNFSGTDKPEGWGTNTKIFKYKTLLIYTDVLQNERALQAAIREFFQIKMPCVYEKTQLFVIHNDVEVFQRPTMRPKLACVEFEIVEDPHFETPFIELSYNGKVFGFAETYD